MIKKITNVLLISILLFTNCVFAYSKTDGNELSKIATIIGDDTVLDSSYSATSNIKSRNIEDLDYGENVSPSSSNIVVQKAIECHKYLRENGYTYGGGYYIPDGIFSSSVVDCSAYVSWVLYEAGCESFHTYQELEFVANCSAGEHPELEEIADKSQVQPGDILVYRAYGSYSSGHVELAAQVEDGEVIRVYNCGYNAAISSSGTAEYPETSYPSRDIAEYSGNKIYRVKNTNRQSSSYNSTIGRITNYEESGDGWLSVTEVRYPNGKVRKYRNYQQGIPSFCSYWDKPYWDGNCASDACGPSSIAIVLSGYGYDVNPGDVVDIMHEEFGTDSSDTFENLREPLNYVSGIEAEDYYTYGSSEDIAIIRESFNNARPVIVNAPGHYIVLLGEDENGKLLVSDSATKFYASEGYEDLGPWAYQGPDTLEEFVDQGMIDCGYILITSDGENNEPINIDDNDNDNDNDNNNNNNNDNDNDGYTKVNLKRSESEVFYSNNKQFYIKDIENSQERSKDRYCAIKISQNDANTIDLSNDNFYIRYFDAINYNGMNYNLKLNINSIKRDIKEDCEICFRIGKYNENNEPIDFNPGIEILGTSNNIEIDTSIDIEQVEESNSSNFKGMFYLGNIDSKKGVAIKCDNPGEDILMESNLGSIKYTNINDNSDSKNLFIYSDADEEIEDGSEIYIKKSNLSLMPVTFTFENDNTVLNFGYIDLTMQYNKITTAAENGIITPSSNCVKKGTDKVIAYRPNTSTDAEEEYYLSEIKVDNENIEINEENESTYTFGNVNEDHSIEVIFAKKYIIKFNSNGGEIVNYEALKPGEKISNNEIERKGYEFTGWYDDEKLTNRYDFSSGVKSDLVLFAGWKLNEYNINYNLDSGENNESNPLKYTIEDEIILEQPSREGYIFKGWYEDSDLTTEINSISKGNIGDKEIYAKWEKLASGESEELNEAKYKIEYYFENTDGNYKKNPDLTETYTDEIGKSVEAESKKFMGYEENKKYSERISTGRVAKDDSLTLKLYYDRVRYKVVFNAQGGSEAKDGDLKTQEVKYDTNAKEPTAPQRKGYKFEYWYYKEDGKEIKFDFENNIESNVELFAKWTVKRYTVTYELDGGKNSEDNPEIYTIEREEKFKNPEKEGYQFKGWYEDENYEKSIESTKNKIGDIKIYAKWEKIESYSNSKKATKIDTTVSNKILPNTGIFSMIIIGIILLGIITMFGYRYIKLNKLFK